MLQLYSVELYKLRMLKKSWKALSYKLGMEEHNEVRWRLDTSQAEVDHWADANMVEAIRRWTSGQAEVRRWPGLAA